MQVFSLVFVSFDIPYGLFSSFSVSTLLCAVEAEISSLQNQKLTHFSILFNQLQLYQFVHFESLSHHLKLIICCVVVFHDHSLIYSEWYHRDILAFLELNHLFIPLHQSYLRLSYLIHSFSSLYFLTFY